MTMTAFGIEAGVEASRLSCAAWIDAPTKNFPTEKRDAEMERQT